MLDALSTIVEQLEEAYRGPSWHGPNLRGSVRRVSAKQAAWKPDRDRKCIAEIIVHAAYWKYIVRRRLRGEKRGSFALKGSNWFALPSPFDEANWRAAVSLLDEQHGLMIDAVREMSVASLASTPAGSKVSNLRLLRGAAMHDVYHAGQIQLLKALQKSR